MRGETHKYSALQAGGHPSEQQPSHHAGDSWEYEGAAQSPGHREVIASARAISRDAGQVTTAACCEI